MMRYVLGFLLCLAAVPLCRADDLTDAMTGVDPRNRLQTGQGAAFGEIYGPEEDTVAPETAPEADQIPPGVSYGSYDGGLKSSVSQPDAGASQEESDDSSDSLSTPRLSLPEADTTLGRPDQREGVWYGDDRTP